MKISDLNLSALKYFLDAVERDSISQSSQINHVSRPAVSQAILRLGNWYGKPLLKHQKRNFELTPAGQEFYQRAKLAYLSLNDHFNQASSQTEDFKIGCSASLLELVFPRFEELLKKSPRPVVKIGATDQLLNDLRQRLINVAFVVDKARGSEFKSYPFHTGQFRLLSTTGELRDTLITTESRQETESLERYFIKKKISFKSHIKVESWSAGMQLAALQVGCSLVPDFMRTAGLKIIKVPGWSASYTASVHFRNIHELSDLEKEIIQKVTK